VVKKALLSESAVLQKKYDPQITQVYILQSEKSV